MYAYAFDDDNPDQEFELPIRRPPPNRLLRLWDTAQWIARSPGISRTQIAERYVLSERAAQNDINMLRQWFGLPLIRERGYRFKDHPPVESEWTIADIGAIIISMSGPSPRTARVFGMLLDLAPPHLRPLFDAIARHPQRAKLKSICAAAAVGSYVSLLLENGDTLRVRPLALVPYTGVWCLVCDRGPDHPKLLARDMEQITEIAAIPDLQPVPSDPRR